MPDPAQFPERSLRDFYYILFRHKWKVTIFFLAVVATVTVGTFLSTEIYKAEAKLLVRIGRESVTLDPTATTGQVIAIGQSRDSEINSELEILKSRELAGKVVDALGPKSFLEEPDEGILDPAASKEPPQERSRELRRIFGWPISRLQEFLIEAGISTPLSDREKALIKLGKNLEIETQKNSNILFLSYEAPSAQFAQTVLGRLIDFYNDKHLVIHRTGGSYDFFNRQADQLRGQVAGVEDELKKLKSKTGVSSLEEQKKILMARIGALQTEAESNQAALAISKVKVQDLKEKLAGISPTLVTQETKGSGNYGADLMRARLYELQIKEQDLVSRYSGDSRPVQEIRRQIAEAQALLAKEEPTRTQVTTGINTTHQQLNLDLIKEMGNLSSLEAKSRVLKTQLIGGQAELQELNNTEVKMVNMQRELSLVDAKYRKYSESLEQARIDQAMETNKISNISVVQAATASMKPIRPRKALNLALGLFLGIFGGVGLAFFSEYLDHTLRTPQDVEEKLDLQVLASIPHLKKGHLNKVAN
jgi:uncharacterized protein involved in exopolysaccharide biosynthesis